MDEKKVLDRIAKLMALTRSPVEEEARTAAMCAVSLILEHRVELRFPRAASLHDFPRAHAPARDHARTAHAAHTAHTAHADRSDPHAGASRSRPHQSNDGVWVDEWGQEYKYYEPPPPPPGGKRRHGQSGSKGDGPVPIQSKFDGWCKHCGERIRQGDEALWVKGRGTTHNNDTCRHFWDD